ncbi:PAS domain-containing protein [Kordiimonas lacus]|uniref:PAS domain-containing protein n=1 Tax=Kordiimonas lacus TaxID=637679 RepID=A0A1G6VQB2_9PROT|nr:PAS domain-containing protein [Kordiimonas lacus]SDD55623.1 PAS domain-containing protein [Kordiimonas lacus]
MIENADSIGNDQPALEARFQQDLLNHWREIQHNRKYPDKREFRPQKFPKFLPQLAIVSIAGSNDYDDRLTGATVSEVLKLQGTHDRLVSPPDAAVKQIIHDMLNRASKANGPIYFKGNFQPAESASIPFTALVLPFSHNGDADVLDTLMLAFDFSKTRKLELVFPLEEMTGDQPNEPTA